MLRKVLKKQTIIVVEVKSKRRVDHDRKLNIFRNNFVKGTVSRENYNFLAKEWFLVAMFL